MPAPLSGPGLGLQVAQNLYPSQLSNAPYDYSTNGVALVGGQALPIPAGVWYVSLGMYLFAEWFDPIQGVWTEIAAGCTQAGPLYVKSDGFNFRIANRMGTPVGGVVLTGGDGNYVQATTSISVTGGGGSTWVPLVGGALAVSSMIARGAGYGIPPIVIIPAPPAGNANPNGVGGKTAYAYAVITSGTVTTVSMVDQGAGYPSGTTITLLANPTDPNINVGITLATVAFSTTFAGSITGVLCTNPGSAIATPQNLSLTVAGAGATATVAPVMLVTMLTASVSVGGAGYGLAGYVMGQNAGGQYPPGSILLSREINNLMMRPRPGNVRLTVSGANGSIAARSGAIIDGGMFFQQGNGAAFGTSINVGLGASAGTAGSVVGPAFVSTYGGSNVFDVAFMQPAP